MPTHSPSLVACAANFYVGWALALLGFLSGAVIGLFFAREGFLGGYASLQRRLVRLGHIALVALGLFNVVFSLCPPGRFAGAASICFIVGGVAMPLSCVLAAWRAWARFLFPVPVLALVAAVLLVLFGGIP
ncbi:MAG: hypothetical protein ACREJC_01660 [Tepidisphaeraceae bacterium]